MKRGEDITVIQSEATEKGLSNRKYLNMLKERLSEKPVEAKPKPEVIETKPTDLAEKYGKEETISFLGTGKLLEEPRKLFTKVINPAIDTITKSVAKTFAPTSVSKVSNIAEAIRRRHMGETTLFRNTWIDKSQDFSKVFQWLDKDKQMEIVMLSQENRLTPKTLGEKGIRGKFVNVALAYKRMHDPIMKHFRKNLESRGLLKEFIDNYWTQLWEKESQAKAKSFATRYFLRHRKVPNYRQGIKFGLKPRLTNPVDIDTFYINNVLKLISLHDTLKELKKNNLLEFVKFGKFPANPDWVKLRENVGRVMFPTEKGMVYSGDYYAHPDVARLINNMSSSGLYGKYKLYDIVRNFNNTLNMYQLGVSGYHAMFTFNTWNAQNLSLAMDNFTRGKILEAGKYGLKTIPGINLVAISKDITRGRSLKELLVGRRLPETEYEKQFLEWAKDANVDPKLDRYYAIGAWEGFKRAIREGNYMKAGVKAPFAGIELISAPIMQELVPDIKLVTFADMMKNELERLKPKTDLERREIAYKVNDMIEDRFGQMTYDNLAWHKLLKDLLFISLRSVGWNYGDIREVVGAGANIKDIVSKFIIEGKLPKQKEISQRLFFVLAMPIAIAIEGYVYSMLHGVKPKKLFDYFAWKTGHINPDGSEDRRIVASYLKDWIAFANEPSLKVVRNKLSPFLDIVIPLSQNKDYWNSETYDPEDEWYKRIYEGVKWSIKQAGLPFSIQNVRKAKEAGAKGELAYGGMWGILKAPSYLTRTEAQKYIYDRYTATKGITGKKLIPKIEWRRKVKNLYHRSLISQGKEHDKQIKQIQELIKEGFKKKYITHKGFSTFFKRLRLPSDIVLYKQLPKEYKMEVLKKATPEERQKYLNNSTQEIKLMWYNKQKRKED
jgi:hypothetical protein